jgi:hypothetical protein
MYYDRSVPEALARLLAPGGALVWLHEWLRTSIASEAHAHVQFRRARGGRSRGGIQVYLGRTSPLEIRGASKGHFQCAADSAYRELTPELFGVRLNATELLERAGCIQTHLTAAAIHAGRSFLDGEAMSHAGLMRRRSFALSAFW